MLSHKQRLVVFAKQVGLASWAHCSITNMQRVLNRGWIDFQANGMVLNIQDLKDATIATASVPGTPGVLKPVVASLVADCCQADTRFTRCEFTLTLGEIAANAPTRSLVFQFYIPHCSR